MYSLQINLEKVNIFINQIQCTYISLLIHIFFYFFKNSLLKYSFIHFCCKVKCFRYTNICINTYTFISFLIWFAKSMLPIFPCTRQECLLFIHFIYNNLHLLTPNSHSVSPPSTLALGNHKSSLCESVY